MTNISRTLSECVKAQILAIDDFGEQVNTIIPILNYNEHAQQPVTGGSFILQNWSTTILHAELFSVNVYQIKIIFIS